MLKAFDCNDYWQLLDWINSEELNYMWGGTTYSYPLTSEQVVSHSSKPNIEPFIYTVDGANAGYVELAKVDNHVYRICLVYVSAAYRGQGLAKKMLGDLMLYTKRQTEAVELTLSVYSHNHAALRCYESLGFEFAASELVDGLYPGEKNTLLKLKYLL